MWEQIIEFRNIGFSTLYALSLPLSGELEGSTDELDGECRMRKNLNWKGFIRRLVIHLVKVS